MGADIIMSQLPLKAIPIKSVALKFSFNMNFKGGHSNHSTGVKYFA
jgi:hypothetical protein